MRTPSTRCRRGFALAVCAAAALLNSRCGPVAGLVARTEDWERDLLSALIGLTPTVLPIPIPLRGPEGPEGPAGDPGAPGADGADGQDGMDGAPGDNIIIARAVINADGTPENSDDITATRTAIGSYELTIDVTGDTLPAGTTEDDFEIFISLKEDASELRVAYYVPVSLVGTTLRVDVFIEFGDGRRDNAFSVQVLLPAG